MSLEHENKQTEIVDTSLGYEDSPRTIEPVDPITDRVFERDVQPLVDMRDGIEQAGARAGRRIARGLRATLHPILDADMAVKSYKATKKAAR